MKITSILFLVLLYGNVFAQHDHSSGHSNAPSHNKKEVTHSHRAVAVFQAQLRDVFTASLQLKDELILSDAAKAAASVAEIKNALSKVDLNLLKDEGLMDWMSSLKVINENLEVIANTNDLAIQRKGFSNFNNALYKSLKEFGTGGIVVFYAYCPMANNNAGAYWLNSTKEIGNPYMGEEMLSCGKVKETIQ